MRTVEVERIVKDFGAIRAVDDVSFDVHPGEIFGLLGPNGAGKTTTIRLILDLFKPDSGRVAVLGGPMTEGKKDRIGYMPEDRGLYRDITLDRCLVYLATLKGLSPSDARQRVERELEKFDLSSHRKNKISELSKGMQQKAQIIATLIHEPKLIIVDEPFSGLDPVNTQMVQTILNDARARGVSIVMSTHQMHQVEELCDRIVLINRGRVVLYGDIADIRSRFTGHAVLVKISGELPHLPGVESVESRNHHIKLSLGPDTSPQDLLRHLVAMDIPLHQFEIAIPTLNEIFVRVVSEEDSHE